MKRLCVFTVFKSHYHLCVLFSLQWTSLAEWRRRICSNGGFLCVLVRSLLPKLTPAFSPGTCLMEGTMTSTALAQVQVISWPFQSLYVAKSDHKKQCICGTCQWLSCTVLTVISTTQQTCCCLLAASRAVMLYSLVSRLFTKFICMWLCVVGSHQAVRQTGTVSPCWVMTLVLPNPRAAR